MILTYPTFHTSTSRTTVWWWSPGATVEKPCNATPSTMVLKALGMRFLRWQLTAAQRPPKRNKNNMRLDKKAPFLIGHMGVNPKDRGKIPQIIHFNRGFHYFHHPFWGIPVFGNTHIASCKLTWRLLYHHYLIGNTSSFRFSSQSCKFFFGGVDHWTFLPRIPIEQMSNETKTSLFRVYRGLCYPVIWGL